MSEEKKPKNTLSDFKDLIENANRLAGLIATVIAAITFASGNRLVSYIFILIACASIDFFLWRLIAKPPAKKSEILIASHRLSKAVSVENKVPVQRRLMALMLITLISSVGVGWVGFNAWQDYGQWQANSLKAQGYYAPTATPNELLILIADFDPRGTKKYSVEERLQTALTAAIKEAGILNVRLARMSAVKTEDDARRSGKLHQAVFVLWGWYDDAGFNSNFTIIRESKEPLKKTDLPEVPAEMREFNLFIREGLTAQMSYFATFTVGQLYYWDGKYDEAFRAFDVAVVNLEQSRKVDGLSLDSGSSSLYFFRGVIQQTQKKNLDQAIADYTKTIELDPQYTAAYNNRGIAYYHKGNLDQAIADLTKAIALNPTYAAGYNNRGNAYIDKGNYDQAIADYSKAIELNPKYASAYNNRSHAYSEKSNFDQALADANKAIELDPLYANAYSNRSSAYRNKGNLDQAIADANRAIELDALLANGYYNRGYAYKIKDNLDQAVADYTKAIELDPKHMGAFYNRGLIYKSKGNLEQAIADYTKAIELDPNYVALYYSRANAYLAKSNLDLAIADYTKAIELNQKYENAYWGRGLVYRQKGMKLQAIADFEMYLQLVPNASNRAQFEQWIRELKQ